MAQSSVTVTRDQIRARLARHAARPALVDPDGTTVDYHELLTRAEAVAETIGGERRLVFLETSNTAACFVAYLACLLGAHPVYLFREGDRHAQTLVDRYVPDVILRPGTADWIDRKPGLAGRTLHPDLRVLLSTSGSTGSPKLVKLSLGNIVSNADAIAAYLDLTVDDRAMTSLPFAYSYGMSVVNSHLFTGASLLLNEMSITDPAFFDVFARGGATSFAGVPYTFEILGIGSPDWARTPGLRYITQAGGRLSPDMVRHLAELGDVHGWTFHVMYGQTECAPRIAHLPPEQAHDFPNSIGIAIPGGHIEIVDAAGNAIETPDLPGELIYSGPNVMLGYAEHSADLASGMPPQPHRTGDIACRNAEGLFYIVGRQSRFVKPYGLRINLDDLQDKLRGIVPGAVCSGTDAVIVVAHSGSAHSDGLLMEYLVSHAGLPPAAFHIARVDEIPVLASGKPDYQAVLALMGVQASIAEVPSVPILSGSFLRRFLRQAVIEAGQIIGVARPQWTGVHHIYLTTLNRTSVPGDKSFVDLAGDSMSYVQTSIALEQYLGHLPAGWEKITIDELERESTVEQAF